MTTVTRDRPSRAARARRRRPGWRAAVGAATLALVAAAARSQTQFAELDHKRQLPAISDDSLAVALGDFDRDGDLDVAFGNWQQQTRLYLNDGDARFTDVTSAWLPADADQSRDLLLVDVDNDGDLDLVIANWQQPNRLYRNDGTRFVDVSATHMPTARFNAAAVVAGDVDADGDQDLVLAELDNNVRHHLFVNDGTGRFTDVTAARMPGPTDGAGDVAIGDVDGDFDLDLVFPESRQDRLFLNDGTGTFTDASAARMPSAGSNAVAIGDVDGDGDPDLGLGRTGLFGADNALYLNDGSGRFIDASGNMPQSAFVTTVVEFADVDGDLDLDFVQGNVTPMGPPTPVRPAIFVNDGSGVFTVRADTGLALESSSFFDLALGDLDGDSDLDLVLPMSALCFGCRSLPDVVYLNDGTGRYRDATAARSPRIATFFVSIATGDVDGDGDVDVYVLTFICDLLFLNDGTGRFVATDRGLPLCADGADAELGDVDGDGDLDVLIAVDGQADRLFLNDGTGRFADASARLPSRSAASRAVALGDVDGDRDLDALVAVAGGQNLLYRNDGTGRFADATNGSLPADTDASADVVLLDLDCDGDLDALFANLDSQNRMLQNDGTGRFTDVTFGRLPPDGDASQRLAVADVDGDGDPDVVVGNGAQGARQQNRVYRNDGCGAFSDATGTSLPARADGTRVVVLGDVDEDGDLDLFVGNGVDGLEQDRLFLNDGAGSFVDATAARLPATPDENTTSAAFADVDRDGDRDLLVTGDSCNPDGFCDPEDPLRILTNLHRQLSSPRFPARGGDWQLELHGRPGYAAAPHVALPFFGLSLAPTPLPLPPLGTVFLDPAGLVPLPGVFVPATTGRGSLVLPVPALASLSGLTFHAQALIAELVAPLDPRLTGYAADRVLN